MYKLNKTKEYFRVAISYIKRVCNRTQTKRRPESDKLKK